VHHAIPLLGNMERVRSAFLCADLELTPEVRDDHASDVASWLEVLKNDNRAIFSVTTLWAIGLPDGVKR
jgi:antirestriction protein ArdC